jgi:hypothetical protein
VGVGVGVNVGVGEGVGVEVVPLTAKVKDLLKELAPSETLNVKL